LIIWPLGGITTFGHSLVWGDFQFALPTRKFCSSFSLTNLLGAGNPEYVMAVALKSSS
jgi:hypothetical protein